MKYENTVLFVDDEVQILSSLRRALLDEDYHCEFAGSGLEALAIMENKPVSVIVTDMRMPGMDGLKLLKIAKEKYPDTVRIVLSGYTQLPQVLAAVNKADIFRFIPKPWQGEADFVAVIRDAVSYHRYLSDVTWRKKTLEERNVFYQKILRNMDEKVASYQHDLVVTRRLTEQVFRHLQHRQSEQPDRSAALANVIKKSEQLLTGYFALSPAALQEFSADGLLTELQSIIATCGPGTTTTVEKMKDHYTCVGYYKTLLYVLTFLLENLLAQEDKKIINVICEINLEPQPQIALTVQIFYSLLPVVDTRLLEAVCAALTPEIETSAIQVIGYTIIFHLTAKVTQATLV